MSQGAAHSVTSRPDNFGTNCTVLVDRLMYADTRMGCIIMTDDLKYRVVVVFVGLIPVVVTAVVAFMG